jgi:hypothetical protein
VNSKLIIRTIESDLVGKEVIIVMAHPDMSEEELRDRRSDFSQPWKHCGGEATIRAVYLNNEGIASAIIALPLGKLLDVDIRWLRLKKVPT